MFDHDASIGRGPPCTVRLCSVVIAAVLLTSPSAPAQNVSFRNDVMAVLSKSGCNQGTCHGNQNGKNGFKLSLRGDGPALDFAALTRDTLGRRANPLLPQESLVLLKATAAVPHEGGRRFPIDSAEYKLLARWIAAGMPADSNTSPRLLHLSVTPSEQVLTEPADRVQINVQATFSDGTIRDVTRLAVYEPSNDVAEVTPNGEARRLERKQAGAAETAILVRYLDQRTAMKLAFVPSSPNFRWHAPPESNYIDHLAFDKLRVLRTLPSPTCSDSVFMRRAYLDVLGILPTTEEVRAFFKDAGADKRARLIDRLLDRPEFAEFWALKWSDLLHNEEKALDRKGVQEFHHWIRECIALGKPLNEFARELIAAQGSTYRTPAANFYRSLRDPQTRAETVAQVFLGIRLNCCRCHNHPFDRWTQDDYHSLAACFARVQYKIIENRRKDGFDRHEFEGDQIVYQSRRGEVKHPRTGSAMSPRHLDQGKDTQAPYDGDRLQALADWVASPENPYFARAQVNRIWFHLMGRGLVEPIDDFRASNPPGNGPLLEALRRDFVDHHFDLRHMMRTILNSATYQASAVPNRTNADDESNFSHALVRPLQAEQLLDALVRVTGVAVKFNGYPLGTRAGQLPGARLPTERDRKSTGGEQFLRSFGKPERLLSCECERSADTTLGQSFQLITGDMLNRMLSESKNRIGRLIALGKSDTVIIEECYLAALSRFPTKAEMHNATSYIERRKDRRAATEDIVWGLVNAKEFLLRW